MLVDNCLGHTLPPTPHISEDSIYFSSLNRYDDIIYSPTPPSIYILLALSLALGIEIDHLCSQPDPVRSMLLV